MDRLNLLLNGSIFRELPICDKTMAQIQCDTMNQKVVDAKGYECKLCGNKGYIFEPIDEYNYHAVPCKCLKARESIQRLKRSGLEETIKNCTFGKYIASESWQQEILDKAKIFSASRSTGWFFIGGQPGCGKTHICTAIVRELLLQGKEARYMAWRDSVTMLKSSLRTLDYQDLLDDYKRVEVLYIDDLFKSHNRISDWEVELGFEILSYRDVNRKKLTTIISSEFTIDYIIEIDESIGSRIRMLSGEFCVCIERGKDKNYRLKQI